MKTFRRCFFTFLMLASLVATWSAFATCYQNAPTVRDILRPPLDFFSGFLYLLISLPISLAIEVVAILLPISFMLSLPLIFCLLFGEIEQQVQTELGIRMSLILGILGLVSFIHPYAFPFPVIGLDVVEGIASLSVPKQQHPLFLVLGTTGLFFFCLDAYISRLFPKFPSTVSQNGKDV